MIGCKVCIYIEDINPLTNLKSCTYFLVRTGVGDIPPLINLEDFEELSIYGNKSDLVKEQAEACFNGLEIMVATEEMGGYL